LYILLFSLSTHLTTTAPVAHKHFIMSSLGQHVLHPRSTLRRCRQLRRLSVAFASPFRRRRRCGLVCVGTEVRAGPFGVWLQIETGDISILQKVQAKSAAHSTSFSVGVRFLLWE
jgi:hypothetical protein